MFSKPPKTDSDPQVGREWERMREILRPNFRIQGTTFSGRQKDFPAFNDYLGIVFSSKGVGSLLGPRGSRPLVPAVYVPNRNTRWAPSSSATSSSSSTSGGVALPMASQAEEQTLALRVDSQIRKVLSDYELGVSLIIDKLSGKPRTKASKFTRLHNATWKDRFDSIYDGLLIDMTTTIDTVLLELETMVDQAPIATTVAEAQILVEVIESVNMDISYFDPQREMSSCTKRYKIMKHLDTAVFRQFLTDMQKKPNSPA